MLKLAPNLSKKEQFALECQKKWQNYELPPPLDLPILEGRHILDVGCGSQLWNHYKESHFLALDVIEKRLPCPFTRQCFPFTSFEDGHFDAIYCIDLIAELPEELHRLALSELARLLTLDGKLVISSELENGAKQRFESLVQTEFVIEKRICSYENYFYKLFCKERCNHLILVAKKKRLSI